MGTLEIDGSLCWRGNIHEASVQMFSPGSRSSSSPRHSPSDLTSDVVYMVVIGKTDFQPYTSLVLFQKCKAQVVIPVKAVLPEICPGLHHLCKLEPCRTRVPSVRNSSKSVHQRAFLICLCLPVTSGLESVNVSRGYTLVKTLSFIYAFSKSVFLCALCNDTDL